MSDPVRQKDARNRALRTFLQGLAASVVSAVILVVSPIVSNANGWQDIDWKITGFLLFQAVLAAVFSYLMRNWLDTKTEALLPPPQAGPPNEAQPEAGLTTLEVVILVATFGGILLLWILGAFGPSPIK